VDLVRLVADRREVVSEVAVDVLEIAASGAGALGSCAPAAAATGVATGVATARAGAIPQRSQYPSTIWPLQSGC
jgi:hypothetical protein